MAINRFGRLAAPPDGRDFQYLMRSAMPQLKPILLPKPRKRAYNDGPLLDQGHAPECVGYACRGFLDAAPIMSKASQGPSARLIYTLAQELDEWPGSVDSYAGTSIRAGMKALQASGQIASYVWGQTVEDALAWMNGGYGTCVLGTNWYAEMSDVDNSGFMREPPSAMSMPIGGHAWRLIWFDVKKQGFLMRNSWGQDFGWLKQGRQSGYAYVRKAFLERLVWEAGDVAAPVQIHVKAVPV